MNYRYREVEKFKRVEKGWLNTIPKEWDYTNLGFFCEFIMGQAPHSDTYNTRGDGTIFIKAGDFGEKYPIVKNYTTTPLVYSKKGDILICIVGATSGKINFAIDGSISRSVAALRVKKELNNRYLYYLLDYSYPNINDLSNGSAQGIINKEILKNIVIPLPNLETQLKISNFLDNKTAQFDSLISKKEALIEKLEEAKKSLISEVVTGKVKVIKTEEGYKLIKRKKEEMKNCGVEWFEEIPKEWKYSKLKYLTNQIIDGSHSTPNYVESGVPFLRVTDITNNKKVIDLNNVKYISIEEHKELIKRCKPEKGDLLVSKNGTIGVTKVVDWDWEFSTFVSLCLIKIKKELLVELLSYFFKSDILDEQIAYGGKKTSITNLHLEKIREFVVPVPKLNEQILII